MTNPATQPTGTAGPVDCFYVQQSPCGLYWNIYDRRTPHDQNRTGYACVMMAGNQALAEDVAAQWNNRPRPAKATPCEARPVLAPADEVQPC